MGLLWVALASGLGAAAACWLQRRTYRRDADVVHRVIAPWWVPAAACAGAVLAAPFFAGRSAVVVLSYLLALIWGLVLAFIDLDVRRLPDVLVLPGYASATVLLVACSLATGDWAALVRAATCAGAAVAVFFLLALGSPNSDGLGLGDVKLSGVLGALLGWLGWSTALMGLLSGFVLGGVVAVVLLLSRRVNRKDSMSFGPFMLLGAYAWCLLGIST